MVKAEACFQAGFRECGSTAWGFKGPRVVGQKRRREKLKSAIGEAPGGKTLKNYSSTRVEKEERGVARAMRRKGKA